MGQRERKRENGRRGKRKEVEGERNTDKEIRELGKVEGSQWSGNGGRRE